MIVAVVNNKGGSARPRLPSNLGAALASPRNACCSSTWTARPRPHLVRRSPQPSACRGGEGCCTISRWAGTPHRHAQSRHPHRLDSSSPMRISHSASQGRESTLKQALSQLVSRYDTMVLAVRRACPWSSVNALVPPEAWDSGGPQAARAGRAESFDQLDRHGAPLIEYARAPARAPDHDGWSGETQLQERLAPSTRTSCSIPRSHQPFTPAAPPRRRPSSVTHHGPSGDAFRRFAGEVLERLASRRVTGPPRPLTDIPVCRSCFEMAWVGVGPPFAI